ncbi:uncharacterized protein PRCAT00001726001 [Priceomyces carsonii]|uniref:uncharacterized protein n=1 Tax=Priceomyces carsonii TaxID=28549 RepID=UPI002ED8624B|nr:unnamed protein product [Priceomyces carsonii]
MPAHGLKKGPMEATRKRRREFSQSPSYIPKDDFLRDNPTRLDQMDVPEDSKVLNTLNRIGQRQIKDNRKKHGTLNIVLGLTEAEYFECQDVDFTKILNQSFGVVNFKISKAIVGTIERILTISGDTLLVSKAAVYIAFLLLAKINRIINNELYTLKSNNYSLTLIVSLKCQSRIHHALEAQNGIEFDSSESYGYNGQIDLQLIQIKGDFYSLLGSLNAIISLDADKVDNITQEKILGMACDPNLFQISPEKEKKTEKKFSQALNYIYSKSILQTE